MVAYACHLIPRGKWMTVSLSPAWVKWKLEIHKIKMPFRKGIELRMLISAREPVKLMFPDHYPCMWGESTPCPSAGPMGTSDLRWKDE